MADGAIKEKNHDDVPFRQVILNELSAVLQSRAELMTPRDHTGIIFLVLFVCVLTNVIFSLARTDYFGLFIAASFYLNMYYFITLLIPTNLQTSSLPAADLSRFHTWLKEIGVKSGTTQFTRLFINSLFMNSRALSLGIGLIFSIDIVFVLIHYARQELPLKTTIIVITQCAIIVIFYLLVWKMEPFSTSYVSKVEDAKRTLRRKKLPPRLVTGMFIFGFLIAIFLFLTTMIYLPGVTLNAFLNQSELKELGHLFSLLAILAVSQYFLVRYIHGITSRTMAERIFDFKEQSLQELLDRENKIPSGSSEPDENPLETSALLLESKIFIIKRNSLAGAFPVFVVDLDFSVMMDSTTLTAIKGYIVERKQ
ncbi:MAG: hypothetical protein Q7U51_05480 [Methanoregula sp.]|nr:hypothetical protein [Methanoregula sp.]